MFAKNSDKIILAMDVSRKEEIHTYFTLFSGHITTLKIGKQLFTRYGPDIVKKALDFGFNVFLDLKYHDIPNTVKYAVAEAAALGVSMLTVHCAGGTAMLKNAIEGARLNTSEKKDSNIPLVFGVTVLTSITGNILNNEIGIPGPLKDCVRKYALLAENAGLNGVISSPHEIKLIKNTCEGNLSVITPGIRPVWSGKEDQKRTMGPKEALKEGADYLVIGRAITAQPDPLKAFYRIIDDIKKGS